MYSNLVDDVVYAKQFGKSDFLQQQKQPLADHQDVAEVVSAYAGRLVGDNTRRKYNSNRAGKLEAKLTSTGRQKFNECKIEVRMRIEAIKRKKQEKENIQPVPRPYVVPDAAWPLMETMQEWGNSPEDSAKYYLHMVFRYQLRLLHDALVRKGHVLKHPSLQYILDVMYPNASCSTFPPEFKRFMVDCSERRVNVTSLPVPKRGSAKDVTYSNNFELSPAVSALRRKLHKTITRWGYQNVYPRYLIKGREGNDAIVRAVASAAVARERQKLSGGKHGHSKQVIATVVQAVPAAAGIGAKYARLAHKTSGERLNERLGFFLRPSVRNVFTAIKREGFVEEVFDVSRSTLDNFRNFYSYCTTDLPLPFLAGDTDGNESRKLLLLLESVVYLFDVSQNYPGVLVSNPDDIVREAIAKLENRI